MSKAEHSDDGPNVAIIGTGLAGIATAIALKKQLGFERFTIYEKAESPGGVWRDNTYPGCGVDIPAHWYSLSSDLNPHWSSFLPPQPELRAYCEQLYAAHALAAHTSWHTELVSARWDADAHVWELVLEDVGSKERRTARASVLVQAAGGFQAPLFPPDVPGAERFRGPVWHSARWRHDVALAGKTVAVVGNGCSAAQLIPVISEDPSVRVVNLCRTPSWFVPRAQFAYSAWVKWVFAHVPFVMKMYRSFIMAKMDFGFIFMRKLDSWGQRIARREMIRYIKATAPAKYHDSLIPSYPPGCKRIVLDPNYLESLHRPNVSLRWDPIECIVEEGIKLQSGEVIPVDAIVFGTGYSVVPSRLEIHGSRGLTLMEYYASQGGGAAYLGTNVPGFPNFYALLGPNSAGGHASVVFVEEAQIQYGLQLIIPVLRGEAKSFEVRQDTVDAYDAWVQKGIARSVYNHCQSYYRSDRREGKNIAIFPGPVSLFWWLARRVRWENYHAVGAEQFWRRRRLRRLARWGVLCILALVWFGASRKTGGSWEGARGWIGGKLSRPVWV